ncbi:MAG: D-amino acid dehydrogenase [Betaproteobacteria bacterium]
MRLAVIGAGVIGTTSAYELACDGHQVTVFERRAAAAEESSFANAGVMAPGYVTPWAAPGMPGKVARHLLSRHAPVRLALPLSLGELAWMWHWFRACKLRTYQANRARMQRLALYSRERLHQISADLQLQYDHSTGYLVLLRSQGDSRMAQPGLQVLRDAGIAFAEVSPDQAHRIEPALNPDAPLFGAIHLAQDEVANCRQFTLLLKNQAQRMGVQFEFNTSVRALTGQPASAVQVEGEPATRSFDAVVVCAGLDSARLLRPLGVKIPMVAVYGYSVSAPLREPLHGPRSAVMDEHYKVAISRLGQHVRVAGSAEIGGSLASKRAASLRTLYQVLSDWFPGAAQLSRGVQEWKGARPMLPDGPPILGASGVPGVWLNLGHGASGWALSCGSARALADLMAQRTPALDLEGLGMQRLG